MTCLRWEYRVTFVGAIPLLFFFFDTKTKNLRTPWFWLLSFGCKVLSLWMLVEFSFFIQMFLPCCESMLFSLTYWVAGSMNPGHFSTCFFVVFVNIYHLFHHNVHQFVFIFLNSMASWVFPPYHYCIFQVISSLAYYQFKFSPDFWKYIK